jgi:hypothetical protein
MHTGIDAFTPRMRLAIEIIQIRKGDPSPQARLHMADRALDFAFRPGRVRILLANSKTKLVLS